MLYSADLFFSSFFSFFVSFSESALLHEVREQEWLKVRSLLADDVVSAKTFLIQHAQARAGEITISRVGDPLKQFM